MKIVKVVWDAINRKHFNELCLNRPVDYGLCVQCHTPACGAQKCKLCGKQHAHCHSHAADSRIAMRGHILRVHPELVPGVVDKLMASGEELAALRVQYELNPELWARLFEYMAERRN